MGDKPSIKKAISQRVFTFFRSKGLSNPSNKTGEAGDGCTCFGPHLRCESSKTEGGEKT